jgi:acyl carrier protein
MRTLELIASSLQDKVENLSDATGRETHRRWDSFAHVQIVVSLEEEFKVKFSVSEIDSMSSVGSIRALLRSKGLAA